MYAKTFGFACGALLASVALVPSAATAAVLYDNLSSPITGADGTNATTGVPNSQLGGLFGSFSNLGGTRTLTEVDLDIYASNPRDGQQFTVSLWTDKPQNGNAAWPNVELWETTSNDSILNSSPTVESFFPDWALAGDTRYWIGLQSLAGSVEFSAASVTTGIGVANEFYINASGLSPNSDGPYLMRIVATPEPATWVMMVAGFAALGLVGRRSWRNRAPIF